MLLLALVLLLAACGSDQAEVAEQVDPASEEIDDPILIVATTSILGDVVQNLVGDDAIVRVIMPPGADPHTFQPSPGDGVALREAALVVANGLMLEENLVDMMEAAALDGANILELANVLDPIEYDFDGPHSHGHEDDAHDDHGHEEDGHGHEESGHSHGVEDDHGHEEADHGADDHGADDHAHGPYDPHFWFDPVRMADAVRLVATEIAAVDTRLADSEWEARGESYAEEILEVHAELEAMFATIAPERRVLVTNHDALGYLAHRYEFEVLGTVVPGSSTQAETDPRSFARLIEDVERAQVPAVFAENTDSARLAEQLASEIIGRGDLQVEVVRIYTDALGEPGSGADTYLGLLRTTAGLIVDALA